MCVGQDVGAIHPLLLGHGLVLLGDEEQLTLDKGCDLEAMLQRYLF